MSYSTNNEHDDSNNAPQESGLNRDRSRHLTNLQLSAQVNQLADTVNQIQIQQQSIFRF